MTRTPRVVAGKWKMHHGPEATRSFLRAFRLPFEGDGPRVLLFPPAVSVTAAVESEYRDSRVGIGVQNVHFEDRGAFTGEISPRMAAEAGATHTLVGHSERRHVFGETDDDVARKVRAAGKHGLTPVVCVGETLAQREAGRVEEVILAQLRAALEGLDEGEGNFLLAYEPVWAIGTGKTATPDDAAAAHAVLRRELTSQRGEGVGASIPILYGGSVKPHNAAELLDAPDVDGVLVGGASLDAGSFSAIVGAAL